MCGALLYVCASVVYIEADHFAAGRTLLAVPLLQPGARSCLVLGKIAKKSAVLSLAETSVAGATLLVWFMCPLGLCRCFKGAVEKQLDPAAFVEGLKKHGKRVPGIGHRIKSKDNRDARVELLQRYARKVGHQVAATVGKQRVATMGRRFIRVLPVLVHPNTALASLQCASYCSAIGAQEVLLPAWALLLQFFPGHKHLDYALKVEDYTLAKAANLVLNVDGCIAGEYIRLLTSAVLSCCSTLCPAGACLCSQLDHLHGWQMPVMIPVLEPCMDPWASHHVNIEHVASVWCCAVSCVAALFLDLLASSGCFTQKEMDDIIAVGYLNGLFVLARSIGLIGHTLDQKRLQQPLYRHAWEDVL